MSQTYSPILIFGDQYLSKNNILSAKKKYVNVRWITKSATKDSLNSIRMEAGLSSWDDSNKIILIQDLPNKKQVREFLLDLASSSPPLTRIIVWDSNGHIKVSSKKKEFDKTWGDFVKDFKKIKGSTVVNNGGEFDEKQQQGCVGFVKERFAKKNIDISDKDANLLIDIVGYNRGMLDSDIKKMSLVAPPKITTDFILDNSFPSSKEAVQYKLANILDKESYEKAIYMMERFLESGTNANTIAEICVRKARWQLVATYLWVSGLNWNDVAEKMMEMGKFPSMVWHSPMYTSSQKRTEAEKYQDIDKMRHYFVWDSKRGGLLLRHFKRIKKETSKKTKASKAAKSLTISRKGAEIIPMHFMATQVTDFIKRIVSVNKVNTPESKNKLLDRAVRVFLFCHEKLSEVRYGNNPVQDLQEAVKVLTNIRMDNF